MEITPQGHFSYCTIPRKWQCHVYVCLFEPVLVWYNKVYGCTDGSANHRADWKCLLANVHCHVPGEDAPPCSFSELRTFFFCLLLFGQQSIYKLWCDVYTIDLIKHIVDKVLRNPPRVFPLPSNTLITLPRIGIHSSLVFLLFFFCTLFLLLVFPTSRPCCVPIPPALTIISIPFIWCYGYLKQYLTSIHGQLWIACLPVRIMYFSQLMAKAF